MRKPQWHCGASGSCYCEHLRSGQVDSRFSLSLFPSLLNKIKTSQYKLKKRQIWRSCEQKGIFLKKSKKDNVGNYVSVPLHPWKKKCRMLISKRECSLDNTILGGNFSSCTWHPTHASCVINKINSDLEKPQEYAFFFLSSVYFLWEFVFLKSQSPQSQTILHYGGLHIQGELIGFQQL